MRRLLWQPRAGGPACVSSSNTPAARGRPPPRRVCCNDIVPPPRLCGPDVAPASRGRGRGVLLGLRADAFSTVSKMLAEETLHPAVHTPARSLAGCVLGGDGERWGGGGLRGAQSQRSHGSLAACHLLTQT